MKITDWWSTSHSRPCVHHEPRWLLHRVDYCNALLYGVTDGIIWWLQSVLHAADQWSLASDAKSISHRHCVTLFTGCRYQSASPSELHWWCLIVHAADVRSTYGNVYTPVRIAAARLWLRSADHDDIGVPHARFTWFGCCSFSVCGPTIWNKLPHDLRSTDTKEQFKHSLGLAIWACIWRRHRQVC